ncbi:restriction endonuclease subunit S [Caulobacter sp. FWC2]|uniref:restriction endonuclease subunit S n=1 Tax=Caulobacter sp. FWC2 TaxID=69664 RepID=UPI000C15A666|nr:restriction endonuclease subunit S [Caulobacter sp. FWC2]PIB90507.1 hypothetical protein CSW62_02340 [Caulobacter sp. FWC2]
MSFPAYESYKESGVEWLGRIPFHWKTTALKRFCALITDGAHVSPITENGMYCFVSTVNVSINGIDFENCLKTSEENYRYLVKAGCKPEIGDVLFSKDGTIGRTVVVSEAVDFVVASSLIIIRPDQHRLDCSYLNHLCQSEFVQQQVARFVKGAGLPRLSIQNLVRVIGIFPSMGEQRTIAIFLDREVAKIDALVEGQRRLIELLKEKRQAVISHAVTKGLDPSAPMKDSGVEWLGEVPAHWEVCFLKRAFSEVDYGISDSLDADDGVAVLRMGNIQDGEIDLTDLKYVTSVEEALLLRPLDLLFNRTNSLDQIGKVGLLRQPPSCPLSFASYLVRLRLNPSCSPQFMSKLLNTRDVLGQARARAFVAIGQCNLNPTRYGEITVALPPIAEQEQIATYLEGEAHEIDALVSTARTAITLLQERRAALISAAVTGKIDVRGLVQTAEAA